MVALLQVTAAERRLLPEGRLAGPMPWVIGIMMFLTILATATGLSIGKASSALSSDIASKLTVQLPEANATRRNGQARAIVAELAGLGSVKASCKLDDAELAKLLAPWLGTISGDEGLPLPALIDVELARSSPRDIAQVRDAVLAIAPNARVDANASWLAPLSGLYVVAAMAGRWPGGADGERDGGGCRVGGARCPQHLRRNDCDHAFARGQ